MTYYKVLKGDINDRATGYTTIKNELLTERERETHFKTLNNSIFKIVNISKRNIYFMFGARFQNNTFYND